jgi:hypothetical protein
MAKQTFTSGNVLTAAQMTSLQQTAMGGGSATAKTTSYVLVAADAGTTVIMNAAGATTITVNTALFSAGDTVNIQNIGAGVCTITAGTATVNTAGSLAMVQYEGGVLYFVSASVATYFDYFQAGGTTPVTTKGDLFGYDTAAARIPIGTNNQVLTADSAQALGLKWAAVPAAAKSFSLINTGGTALTGATTVTYSGLSGYDSYLVVFNGASSANTYSLISMRINGDTAANYGYFGNRIEPGASYAVGMFSPISSTGATSFPVGGMSGNAGSVVRGAVTISGANSSGAQKILDGVGGGSDSTDNNNDFYALKGYWSNSATITSISAVSETGNFDAGTMFIYGSA